jgi:superfamily II DNA or RNA helicase
MRVDNKLTVHKSEPCYSDVLSYCKKNLVLSNPEYSKKARMHFWLGDTPKTLNLFESIGDELVLPFGTLRDVLKCCNDVRLEDGFGEKSPVDFQCDVPLYDYQKEALRRMVSAHYGILQSPAGSGKTQIGIAMVAEMGCRALWLCTTLDLIKQSKSRAEMYMSKDLIGTITEGKVNIGEGITFATIQTMCKLDLAQYKDFWDVIIVDECHRCAGTPTSMTQFYKVLNSLSARHKIGLSATVHRSDGLIAATHSLLGEIVYTVPEEAVGDRIMRVGVQPIGTGVEISRGCLNTDGTLNYTKLITYLCESEDRNDLIVSWIEYEEGRSALILSDRLKHLQDLMTRLPPQMQEQAVMISGKMTSKKGKVEREQAIEDMRTGRKTYLFATYSLAKEGLDIPRLERLFMTTPQKDYAVVTQSIGRIARTHEGKSDWAAPNLCTKYRVSGGGIVKVSYTAYTML